MLRRAQEEMVNSGCRGVVFAIETGSHYWRNLAYFLDGQGFPYRFINQFTLKRRREGKDLNRRKNDYRDNELAAGDSLDVPDELSGLLGSGLSLPE
jgi:transposase